MEEKRPDQNNQKESQAPSTQTVGLCDRKTGEEKGLGRLPAMMDVPDEVRKPVAPIWTRLIWPERVGCVLSWVAALFVFLTMFVTDCYTRGVAVCGLLLCLAGFGFLSREALWKRLKGNECVVPLWWKILLPCVCFLLLMAGIAGFLYTPVPGLLALAFGYTGR